MSSVATKLGSQKQKALGKEFSKYLSLNRLNQRFKVLSFVKVIK